MSNKSVSEIKECRWDLVDMESDVEEVDFALLPAVFLQQLHQHRALFRFLLLFLCSLLLLRAHRLIDVVVVAIILVLILIILII